MAIIAACCPKSGGYGTATAVLAASGLAWSGHPVELVQVEGGAEFLTFDEGARLPFAYTPMVWEGEETYKALLAAMDRARSERRHLVIDVPAHPFDAMPSFVERLDLPLVPVRSGSAYVQAACRAAEAILGVLSESEAPLAARPWLLPVGWTSPDRALWQIKGIQEARTAADGAAPLAFQVVPWSVPHLPSFVADAVLDPDTLDHTPQLRPVAIALGKIVLRLAADPSVSLRDAGDLFGEAKGDAPRQRGDARDLPQRLWELADDLAVIKAGQGPSDAELDAAPVLNDWYLAPEMSLVLVGRVEGHPVLGSRWIRTSLLYHFDELRSFARTLSRFYRLGRRRDEDEQ